MLTDGYVSYLKQWRSHGLTVVLAGMLPPVGEINAYAGVVDG